MSAWHAVQETALVQGEQLQQAQEQVPLLACHHMPLLRLNVTHTRVLLLTLQAGGARPDQAAVRVPPAQVAALSDELERTRTAAKGDIRTLSVELQGLREQQAALRRQQDAAQARP
jgi:hypothetical protein